VHYHVVEEWDSDSDDPWIRNRNLSFRNQVIEGSVQGELNFFNYQLGNRKFPVSPYLFGGLAYYRMRPMAEYRGTWYELQPLGTEGQGSTQYQDRKPYQLSQLGIPLGAGFKVRFNDNWNASMEFGFRTTFTDYLDDVSSNAYVEPEFLKQNQGSDNPAAQLSDRSGEKMPWSPMYKRITDDPDTVDKVSRGNKNTPADFFMFATVSLCYRFPLPGIKCTSF
jgi:hypothetical protein